MGLLFDITGAYWLAKSIVWRSKRQIELETKTFYGSNPFALAAAREAKEYGWFGFAFLFIGFSLQALGQIFPNLKIKLLWFLIIIIVLLLFSNIFSAWTRKKSNKSLPEETKKRHGEI